MANVVVDAYAGIESRKVPSRRCTGTPSTRASEVPESDVDDADQPDRKLVRAIELPQAVPQPLATVSALSDELLAEHPVDDVAEHRTAPLVVRLADRAVLRRDAEDGGGASLGGATEAAPPRERRGHRRDGVPARHRWLRSARRHIIIRMTSRCQVRAVDPGTAPRLRYAGALRPGGDASSCARPTRSRCAAEISSPARPRRARRVPRRCGGDRWPFARAPRVSPRRTSAASRRRAGG